MKRWWMAVPILAACTPPAPELTPRMRAAVAASIKAWRQAGLPEPDAERCDLDRVYVRWAPLEDACPSPMASSAIHYACLAWESSGHWFRPRQYPVIVLRPGLQLDEFAEPIPHEMMHALAHCSSLPYWLPANTEHRDPRIWSGAELVPGTSAQSRARVLMAD